MSSGTVVELNARFGIRDRLAFAEAAGGLIMAEVSNAQASARIALQGAQIIDWTPAGERPVIWLSPNAVFAAGKALRGGVPVCWPWFGPHPARADFPAHGFARTRSWEVWQARQLADGSTLLGFRLPLDAETWRWWPHDTQLTLLVKVGTRLQMELRTRNAGDGPFTVSQALHTYFAVGDVREVEVRGLEGRPFIDKLDGGARRRQDGPLRLCGETDRIYLDQGGEVVIDDPVWRRRIHIGRQGSRSAVVWNPWAEKSAAMADMGADAWRGMLCVEAANAADDAVTIPPGGEHRLQFVCEVAPR